MSKNTAITLINFMVALRRLPPLSELSGEEERLLFELHQVWESSGELTVSDVYDLVGRKSASTAYRHLMNLRDKGLVDLEVDLVDKRKRTITFTKQAQRLFAALG